MAKHPAKCPKCGSRLEYESAVDEKMVCPGCQVLLSMPGKHKLSDKVDPLIGQSLGEFEIVELLGRGGMGAVYKAKQPSLGRFVAVKVLPRAVSRDSSFVERFSREARAAASVNHPNIVQVYAVGHDKGFQFIAMELVDGESLLDILKRDGRVPPERAIEWMKQVGSALTKAHAAGIVHRDIKPSNILVTSDDLVKVADFGLAKRPGMDVSVTETGAAVGTPLYFAPEVARGQDADPRSDLYSLGAAFYHLLAGRPPFEGKFSTELALKHAQDPVPPLRQAVPEVPAALAGVIQRLLRKNPQERYQSAQDLLAALERVGKEPAAAHDEATATMPDRGHRNVDERRAANAHARKKLLVTGGAAAAIVLVLVVVLVLVLRPGPRPHATLLGPPTPGTQHPTPSSAVRPSPEIKHPAPKAALPWQSAWDQTEAKAKGLLQDQRYGEAVALYEALEKLFDDARLKAGVADALAAINKQADTACREAERRAKEALAARKFDDARAALRPILDRYGIAWKAEQARKTLEEIAAAERASIQKQPEPKAAPKEDEAAKKKAEEEKQRQAEAKKREEAECKFAEALKPVETLAAAWDFTSALDALSKLGPPTPNTQHLTPFSSRLSTRRDELDRLAKLKARFIAKINAAQPPLDKRALLLTGMNGPIVKADERAITAQVAGTDKAESHDWPRLSPKTVQKLLDLTLDKASPDDWLSAGLLFLAPASLPKVPIPSGGYSALPRDAALAEAAFEKAKSLGASIDRYLDPLASAAFAFAKALLDKKDFSAAESTLAAIEKKYGTTPWLASHKADLASAREAAKSGIAESEAEKLYAEASKLFEKKELFDLKAIIEKLKTDYRATKPVTDAARKPTFAGMAKATDTLGMFIKIRQEGKGDFRSIQQAIEAAAENSTIEVQDSGIYNEKLVIATAGITLRGKKGLWPTITSSGPLTGFPVMVEVQAPGVSIERLVLAHGGTAGVVQTTYALYRSKGAGIRLRAAILSCPRGYVLGAELSDIKNCFAATGPETLPRATVSDSFIPTWGIGASGKFENVVSAAAAGRMTVGPACEIVHCTITHDGVAIQGEPVHIRDSILPVVSSVKPWSRIELCDVYGKPPFLDLARPGKDCFSADPQFRDPANFDYRLKPTSPCRKKASDGGDIGCRYTPEMMEVLEKALELRKKGIIKF